MTKKLMLGKFFERNQAGDFSDDGTFFRSYLSEDNVEITVARNGGELFLDADFPSELIDKDIVWLDEDYMKLCMKAGEVAHKYNGVYGEPLTEELEVWSEDLKYFAQVLREYKKPRPIIYFNTLDEKYYGYWLERFSYSSGYYKKFGVIPVNNSNKNKYTIKRLVVEE